MRPSQAVPSSSGVTATGENAVHVFDWRNPKPFASSAGTRLRSETSLTSMRSRMCSAAFSRFTPIGTSSRITATSPSRSMPQSSVSTGIGSRAPRKASELP